MPLLWRPYEAATAANAADALAGLFAEHGPPLVLKSDNGSHFTGGDFPDLLAAHRVAHLLSPPHWPRYNGAIEAGIHALKDRTEARAARAGHPGAWTWDDAAGAVQEAAELARPHGFSGPSPAASWQARTPIQDAERATFAAAVQRQIACGTVSNGVSSEPRWPAWPSAMHSRSAGIFSTGGGEYSHRLAAERWQAIRRGHKRKP